jgi:hypothetical protein
VDLPDAVRKTIKDISRRQQDFARRKENENGKMVSEAVIKENQKEWGDAFA